MVQLTLQEMIQAIWNLISSSALSIVVFILMLLVFLFLYTTNKSDIKETKILYIGIYILLFLGIVVINYESFFGLWDYLIDHIFVLFYFPNLILYLVMIILTNFIMIRTVFQNKVQEKSVRILNISCFCLIHYLLFLIVSTTGKEEINILNEQAMYNDPNLLALIQVSMGIFAIWLLILFARYVLEKMANKTDPVKEEPVLRKGKDWIEINCPKTVRKNSTNFVLKEKEPKQIEDLFTLDDYKKMLELLQEIKKREESIK